MSLPSTPKDNLQSCRTDTICIAQVDRHGKMKVLKSIKTSGTPSMALSTDELRRFSETTAFDILYADITESLSHDIDWSWFPYPHCTVPQILTTDTFLVAVKVPFEKLSPEAFVTTVCTRITMSHVVGLIGVVWVKLGSHWLFATPSYLNCDKKVEGYLQIFLVRPNSRGLGVGRALLETCLLLPEGNVSYDPGSTAVVPASIVRWRLHTMANSPRTIQYLKRNGGTINGKGITGREEEGQECLQSSSFENESQTKVENAIRLIQGVQKLYTSFGFIIRRNIPNYYSASADAVEMVKTISRKRLDRSY